MENIKTTYRIPVLTLTQEMGLSYDSLMRWKRRIQNGQDPVSKPGPRKIEPLDLKGLQADICNRGAVPALQNSGIPQAA
jgi:hypothetical protein